MPWALIVFSYDDGGHDTSLCTQTTPGVPTTQDPSLLHPSKDHKNPTASENPAGRLKVLPSNDLFFALYILAVAQVLGVPSGADEGADPRSELLAAHDAADSRKPLWGPVTTATSAAQAAQADLATADNIQTTYLLPLNIFNTAITTVANV